MTAKLNQIELNIVEALFITGSNNFADMFMKALDRMKFQQIQARIGN